MDKLLAQVQKLAESQYTRSAQRAKWTRLAGQLLWYKDQILRAMTWEALEQDVHRLMRGSTTRWKRGEWINRLMLKYKFDLSNEWKESWYLPATGRETKRECLAEGPLAYGVRVPSICLTREIQWRLRSEH